MVKNRVIGLFFWAFTLFGSLAAPSLYAGGKPEESLARADLLIAEKKYDEAIRELSEFARRNPERFSEAQERFQRINQIREEYNAIANALLDEVVATEPDMEKVLRLTQALEDLESGSNLGVQDFIVRTRGLALFNFNRQRLGDILERGRALLDAGDFAGALRVYAGGMDIYREDFFASGYGNIIDGRVNGGIDNINNVIDAFPRVMEPLRVAAANIGRAAGEGVDPAGIEALYVPLSEAMDSLIDLRRLLYETADYYDMQLEEFQKLDNTIGDRNFLSFASRLIQGRAGESVQEGMIGVLEGYWNSVISGAEAALRGRVDSVFAAGFALVESGDFEAARRNFTDAREYGRYPLDLIVRRRALRDPGGQFAVELDGRSVLREDAGVFLKYDSMVDAAGYLFEDAGFALACEALTRGEITVVQRWQSGELSATDALSHERELQGALSEISGEVDGLLARASGEETELRAFQAGEESAGDVEPDYIGDALGVIKNLAASVLVERRLSAARYYTVANGELEKRLAARREQFAGGSAQINGISRVTEDRGTVVERYPAEGLAVITAMIGTIADDTREGNLLLSWYSSEPPEITVASEVSALRNTALSMMNEFADLRTRGQGLIAPTRMVIAQADAYRQDGVRYYREAQNALSRQNFDTARDRVTRAAEQFNASLAIQESSSLRNEWDSQIFVLGQEINRLENEMVIRDVRGFVNDARTAYFGGNFERAEDLLVRAQNRWRVTNPENDEEVTYWLNIVRGAVSLRSGRVIPQTAPLYPEMSQLLSEAQKDYDEGVRYLNSGRRGEGLAKFSEARQKTREVKLMFPVNQEAGMLDLRMDRVVDPRAFDASFEQRLRTAIAGTGRRSVEAFAELQNLAEINPGYPGMAGIITRAEISMGMRPPPPDPRVIARSNELRVSAQRILDANNTAQFEVALTQINEAITLNPENTQATIVKDRLLARISRPSAVVMSSQDETAYNQALMEYQQGNLIMALAIVQRLLRNPQYRNISKIVELERRVQALL